MAGGSERSGEERLVEEVMQKIGKPTGRRAEAMVMID